MLQFKLISQFRNNCMIQSKEKLIDDLKVGDIIFLMINNPTKTFSILSKVEEIIENEDKYHQFSQNLLNNVNQHKFKRYSNIDYEKLRNTILSNPYLYM